MERVSILSYYYSFVFLVIFLIFATLRFEANFWKTFGFKTLLIANSSSEVTKALSSSCIGMFDIGFGLSHASTYVNFSSSYGDLIESKDWHQLLREKEAASQSYENYLPFVDSVESKIKKLNNGSLSVQNGTRLQMMDGKLPYVPCIIDSYSQKDLRYCLSTYQERNKKLWITFFGDSRSRNLFLFFIKRTNEIMKWKIDKEKEKDLILETILNFRDHSSGINATSSHDDLISFIPADFGLKNVVDRLNPFRPRDYLLNLLNLSETKRPLPDILIINFGIHEYVLLPDRNIFNRHTDLISNWMEISKILKRLSRKMNVLSLYQTKPRGSSLETLKRRQTSTQSTSYSIHEHILMDYGSRFADNVMRELNRRSDVIQWDSTFPFNLASSEECREMLKQNHFLIDEEMLKSAPFQTLMCHDVIHKARSTVEDETTLLLNLLCNKILSFENIYCCS